MILIDKDMLLKGSNHYWLEMENFGDIEAIDVRFIEMAEEIKAIPVEWIEKYAKRTSKKCCHCATAIWEMLEDWEKENATEVND